ncbi:MAG: precorrin-6A reductase [Clostridiales bacterium]|nr:precorrin-6A reductase [Clostridiales bacterium]
MKIVIFGGTSEGRELSNELAKAGAEVLVSVASDYGAEEQGTAEGVTVAQGAKDEEEIRQMISGADMVVDATHPFAVIVTDNIRSAAEKAGVERLRLLRDESPTEGEADIRYAADPCEAARIAGEIGGRVLLTTGSKDLGIYAEVIDPELLYPRVLPLVSSIEACEEAGIPHRNIIAVQGPFSEELNKAVIRDYKTEVMITKDSGAAGGFPEKIRAAHECRIPIIVIARPEEDGLSFDEILAVCREKMK